MVNPKNRIRKPGSMRSRIEPRVSESTFDRMQFLTGSAFSSLKSVTVRLVLDGEIYEIDVDEHGNATAVREIGSLDLVDQ